MEERDPVLEARLKEQFQGCCFGGAIHAFASCDSTMERAHALARDGGRRSSDRRHSLASGDRAGSVAGEGALIFATRQTQGRGRLGRRWESPDGGAYFSLILRPTRPFTEAPQLSLVAGLAVAEAIRERLVGRVLPISVRWPNDILIDGKKVAGILAETSVQRAAFSGQQKTADSAQNCVIVGIGINVSTDSQHLPDTATSLQKALRSSSTLHAARSTLEPLALVSEVCRKFDGWYDVWTAQGFAPIRQALRPWMSHLGGLVRLKTGSSQAEGQATDLDESGRLLVRLDSGVTRAFDAGEVTLLR